jgi:hypothetical protein
MMHLIRSNSPVWRQECNCKENHKAVISTFNSIAISKSNWFSVQKVWEPRNQDKDRSEEVYIFRDHMSFECADEFCYLGEMIW